MKWFIEVSGGRPPTAVLGARHRFMAPEEGAASRRSFSSSSTILQRIGQSKCIPAVTRSDLRSFPSVSPMEIVWDASASAGTFVRHLRTRRKSRRKTAIPAPHK